MWWVCNSIYDIFHLILKYCWWLFRFQLNIIWLRLQFSHWFDTPNRIPLFFLTGKLLNTHTEKFFPSLIISTWNQIVFTIFWLIWIQTDVRLHLNQSENGKCNLISVNLTWIWRRFLCVFGQTPRHFLHYSFFFNFHISIQNTLKNHKIKI